MHPDLTAAFAELRRRGIIALPNAGRTPSEARSVVAEHRRRAQLAGERPRGAVFFVGQDAARARAREPLHLIVEAFFDGPKHDAAALKLSQEIAEVLRENGLTIVWDGTAGHPIGIQPALDKPDDAPALPAIPDPTAKKRG